MAQCCLLAIKHACLYCVPWNDDDDNDVPLQEQQITQWQAADDAKPSSDQIKYETLVEVAEEESPAILTDSFDASEEYYRQYESLGAQSVVSDLGRGIISATLLEEMIATSERIFIEASVDDLTPREIVQSLNRYTVGIRQVEDLERKKAYIELYEQRKSNFDRENPDDKVKAEFYLQNARNLQTAPLDRIEYYQTAIKYTNHLVMKEQLWVEYRAYCATLKKNSL